MKNSPPGDPGFRANVDVKPEFNETLRPMLQANVQSKTEFVTLMTVPGKPSNTQESQPKIEIATLMTVSGKPFSTQENQPTIQLNEELDQEVKGIPFFHENLWKEGQAKESPHSIHLNSALNPDPRQNQKTIPSINPLMGMQPNLAFEYQPEKSLLSGEKGVFKQRSTEDDLVINTEFIASSKNSNMPWHHIYGVTAYSEETNHAKPVEGDGSSTTNTRLTHDTHSQILKGNSEPTQVLSTYFKPSENIADAEIAPPLTTATSSMDMDTIQNRYAEPNASKHQPIENRVMEFPKVEKSIEPFKESPTNKFDAINNAGQIEINSKITEMREAKYTDPLIPMSVPVIAQSSSQLPVYGDQMLSNIALQKEDTTNVLTLQKLVSRIESMMRSSDGQSIHLKLDVESLPDTSISFTRTEKGMVIQLSTHNEMTFQTLDQLKNQLLQHLQSVGLANNVQLDLHLLQLTNAHFIDDEKPSLQQQQQQHQNNQNQKESSQQDEEDETE